MVIIILNSIASTKIIWPLLFKVQQNHDPHCTQQSLNLCIGETEFLDSAHHNHVQQRPDWALQLQYWKRPKHNCVEIIFSSFSYCWDIVPGPCISSHPCAAKARLSFTIAMTKCKNTQTQSQSCGETRQALQRGFHMGETQFLESAHFNHMFVKNTQIHKYKHTKTHIYFAVIILARHSSWTLYLITTA